MPRLRKNPTDLFSYAELAIGAGMSRREFQHLAEADNLVPPGRGTKAFKRVAAIGAFMAAGVPLFSAARLTKAIVKAEFNQYNGEAPSGLNYLACSLDVEEINSTLPSQAIDTNDYHYHFALARSGKRPCGKAIQSDAIIEIIDRNMIMHSSVQFPKPQIVGWIENWDRASDVDVVHVSERVTLDNWNAQFAALQAAAEIARVNSVARLSVNLSLAIRNAFDRLDDHRQFAKSGA